MLFACTFLVSASSFFSSACFGSSLVGDAFYPVRSLFWFSTNEIFVGRIRRVWSTSHTQQITRHSFHKLKPWWSRILLFSSFSWTLLSRTSSVTMDDGKDTTAEESDPWKKHCMANGNCASIAWTILVLFSVGSSECQNKFEKGCFHESSWFTIHFTFNMIAAILTAATCVIAIYIIRFADKNHLARSIHISLSVWWSSFLTMLQVAVTLWCEFRPTSAADCGRGSSGLFFEREEPKKSLD